MKKTHDSERFKGIKFTCLGLGDSNYTSFMHVPRTFCQKFKELGAECFHTCQEADEVEGLDDIADNWVKDLWTPLKRAVKRAYVPQVQVFNCVEDRNHGFHKVLTAPSITS